MLTLSAEWQAEFLKADCEPVFLVRIYTATSNPLVFCTGDEIFTLSSIYNPFTGASDGGETVYPSVASVSPLNISVDPFERSISRSTMTITFHDDGAIRQYLQSNRLMHKSIAISLGTTNIAAQANWAPVFRGLIDKISVRDGQIDVQCVDHFQYSQEIYMGNWINKHPLEVIEKILTDQGLPAALIDGDSLDPTESDYSDVAHLVSAYWNPRLTVTTGPFGGTMDGFKRGPLQESTENVCTHLAKGMVGSLYAQEDGKIKFVIFNTSATVRANWTADDISNLVQRDKIVINQIDVTVSGSFADSIDGVAPKSARVRLGDSASQSNFAFPGQSKAIFSQSTEFRLLDFMGRFDTGPNGGFGQGAQTIRVETPFGISGTRVTGNYTSPGPWEDMQASGTNITADRPLYIMVDDEMMKCVSLDMVESSVLNVPEWSGTSTTTSYVEKPEFADLTITSANRGQFSTTNADHTEETETDGRVLDMTCAIHFAETQLQRFSNGVAVVELSTSLAQYAV